jgi:hypothetical protein
MKVQNDAAYTYMKKAANRTSFNGWCGAYVGHTLVYLGINKSYIGRNGCDHWDYYSRLTQTGGGYSVETYSGADYTLESALKALASQGDVTNIVLCFDKGSSNSDGQKYGHVIFLHGILDGTVYYSECFSNSSYAEGALRAETIAKVCSRYKDNSATSAQEYRFEGAIRFYKKEAVSEDGWSAVMSSLTKPTESASLRIVKTETAYHYYHYCCNYYDGKMNVDSISCGSGSHHYHTLRTASELSAVNVSDQGGKTFFQGTKCSCGFQVWAKADSFKTVTYYYQVKDDASARDPWTYSSATPTRELSYDGNPDSVMVGSDVCWVQCALNAISDAGLKIDGKYGSDCAEKVKSFQRDHGLTVDGCVGPQVYTELVKQLHDRGCFEPHVCQGAADANCVTAEICSVCGITLQPALGHSYTAKITPPTCIAEGFTTHTCVRCGDSIVDTKIPSMGHNPAAIPALRPTCTDLGKTEGSRCSTCGEILVRQTDVAPLGHTETALPAKGATCIETGLTGGSRCEVCGETLISQQEIPAKGHTAVIDPAKTPTCTEAGLTEGKHCSACGEILVARAEVAPTGHVPDGWSVVAEPSVGVAGKRQQACSACGAVLNEETIPALPVETEPVTDLETDPVTAPVTDPATDPETVPVTDPVTETPTAPAETVTEEEEETSADPDGWETITIPLDGCSSSVLSYGLPVLIVLAGAALIKRKE